MRGAVFALVIVSLTPAAARADTYSLFTVGIGTNLAYDHVRDYDAPVAHSFNAALSLRLQLLRYVAIEIGYAPMQGHDEESGLVFASSYRYGLMLYPVHEEEFGIYLSGGIGASRLEDLISVTAETNTYQFGAGFDVYFEDNFAIGASFSVLVPGVSSIERTMVKQALTAAESFDPNNPPELPTIGDFLSIENFRVSITSQYYF